MRFSRSVLLTFLLLSSLGGLSACKKNLQLLPAGPFVPRSTYQPPLLYTINNQVWAIDVLTGEKTLFMDGTTIPFYLSWSPDYSRLAYHDADPDTYLGPIRVRDRVTGATITLPGVLASYYGIRWSQDGRRLVALQYADGGTDGDLYLYDFSTGLGRTVTMAGTEEYDPDISPDGNRVAFFSSDGYTSGTLWVMGFDGSGMTDITPSDTWISEISWLHDGRLLFQGDSSADSEIQIMNPDGTGLVSVSNNPGSGDYVCYPSPDHRRVVFASERAAAFHAYVANMDGSGLHQVTNFEDTSWMPYYVWSPDGKWLAFRKVDTMDGTYDIWRVDVETGASVQLTDDSTFEREICWGTL